MCVCVHPQFTVELDDCTEHNFGEAQYFRFTKKEDEGTEDPGPDPEDPEPTPDLPTQVGKISLWNTEGCEDAEDHVAFVRGGLEGCQTAALGDSGLVVKDVDLTDEDEDGTIKFGLCSGDCESCDTPTPITVGDACVVLVDGELWAKAEIQDTVPESGTVHKILFKESTCEEETREDPVEVPEDFCMKDEDEGTFTHIMFDSELGWISMAECEEDCVNCSPPTFFAEDECIQDSGDNFSYRLPRDEPTPSPGPSPTPSPTPSSAHPGSNPSVILPFAVLLGLLAALF